ncbi:MAG: phosphodiester glycosidase family protein [Pleomorphochaeta sp.]
MKSEIVEIQLEDNNIQKYQIISGFNWEDLIFKSPPFNIKTIKAMARLYEVNIIPENPKKYGNLIFFHSLEDFKLDRNTDIGFIYNNQVLLNYYFNKANDNNEVEMINGVLSFKDEKINNIYKYLLKNNLVSTTKGEKEDITFFPVSSDMGYLSSLEGTKLSVNSHFFLMDETDLDSLYDELGTPHGLSIYRSNVYLPPLNHRECLLINYNGEVELKKLTIDDLEVKIGKHNFIPNINASFYSRPKYRVTPKCEGVAIVIVKNKVVGIKDKGEVVIPMAGFVIQTDSSIDLENLEVEFNFTEQYMFGVQVGPTMVSNFRQLKDFESPFYRGEGTLFPSTVYPLDYNNGRAARIGLGVKDESPILIWVEGAGKLGHIKGKESCGASLLEFSKFCKDYGIKDLVNLDGGGSAQLIFNGKKYLKIADRHTDKVTEAERPVPYVLVIH